MGRNVGASQADKVLAQGLALLVAQPSLTILASALVGALGIPTRVGALAVYLILLLAALRAIPAVLHHATPTGILATWVTAVLFAGNIVLHGGFTDTSLAIAPGLAVGLIWLLLACSISNFNLLRNYLYFVALLILLAGVVELTEVSSALDQGGYAQYIGYLLLPAAVILGDAVFRRHSALNSGLAGIALLMLVSTGARGPLVAAVVFLATRAAWRVRKSAVAAIVAVLVGVGALIVSQAYRDDILLALVSWLERWGLSTRSIERFTSDTLFVDETRDALVRHTFGIIDMYPLFGIGIGNDYEFLAQEMGAPAGDALGWYPHNIVLEVLAQFGIVVGSIMLLLLVVLVFRAIVCGGNPPRSATVLIFIAVGLVPLFFSGTYLNWPSFFALIGICLSAKTNCSSSRRLWRNGSARDCPDFG